MIYCKHMLTRLKYLVFFYLLYQLDVNAQRPNIYMVIIDDARAFEFDNHAITPNLDNFQMNATNYKHAFAQEAMCNASRSSFLTGLRPDRTGVHNTNSNFRNWLPNVKTLPQILMQNGYETIGVGKIFHHKEKLAWSVDAIEDNRPDVGPFGYITDLNKQLSDSHGRGFPFESADVADSLYIDGWNSNRLIKSLLVIQNSANPIFAGIGFGKPHLPFTAPKKFWDLYSTKRIDSLFNILPKSRPSSRPDLTLNNSAELRKYFGVPLTANLSDSLSKQLIHGYLACLSYIDHLFGQIVSHLKSTNQYDESMIIVFSDHGMKIGEYNTWSKHTNLEVDCKVPLTIKYPDQKKGAIDEKMSELIDIFPTILDVLDLEADNLNLDGSSLLNNKKMFSLSQWKRSDTQGYSVRTKNFRYTGWFQDGSLVYEELYDKNKGIYDIENIAYDIKQLNTIYQHRKLLHDATKVFKNDEYIMKSFSDLKYSIGHSNEEVVVKFLKVYKKIEIILFSIDGSLLGNYYFKNTDSIQIASNRKNKQIVIGQILVNNGEKEGKFKIYY